MSPANSPVIRYLPFYERRGLTPHSVLFYASTFLRKVTTCSVRSVFATFLDHHRVTSLYKRSSYFCAVSSHLRLWKSKARKKVIPSAILNHSKCLPYGLPFGSMLVDVDSRPSLYPHSVLKVFSLLVISQYVYLSSRLHRFGVGLGYNKFGDRAGANRKIVCPLKNPCRHRKC